ncbi:MAG: zinc metallopeptidase [Oscillospiraceae bacterium]|nr:zinc metallopeptidase [Oscillospiraceae bacterium]
MYAYGMDMNYIILVMPAIIFSLWAQHMVKSNFKRYSKIRSANGLTGAAAAQEVLRKGGVSNVRIESVSGSLSDHFDPRDNVIRLSESVYDKQSIAAVGVAAHEAGHALQYANGYAPMKLRAAIIPVTSFGSKLAMPLVILGLVLGYVGLINLGILFFALAVLFQLVTLPVEFNASMRAVRILDEYGLLKQDEMPGAKKVLRAAAMTYVAALAVSLAQLLRLIAMSQRRGRR